MQIYPAQREQTLSLLGAPGARGVGIAGREPDERRSRARGKRGRAGRAGLDIQCALNRGGESRSRFSLSLFVLFTPLVWSIGFFVEYIGMVGGPILQWVAGSVSLGSFGFYDVELVAGQFFVLLFFIFFYFNLLLY